jgi:hypothetical protein
MGTRTRLLLAIAALTMGASAMPAQSLVMSYDANNHYRGVLNLIDALGDSELEEAVRSGLPLRIRFRAEMWKDGIVDDLLGAEQWTSVLTFDPLAEQYILRTRALAGTQKAFNDYRTARAAIEGAYLVSLRPSGSGRYYFTGVVTIETLSLSDLAELERWLKGELQPAVSGDRSLPGALGEGAKRLFMRVLSLPERRFEGRSNRFRVP